MDGEPLGNETKVLGVVQGLKKGTKLRKLMNKECPSSYVDFKHQAGILISNIKMLA